MRVCSRLRQAAGPPMMETLSMSVGNSSCLEEAVRAGTCATLPAIHAWPSLARYRGLRTRSLSASQERRAEDHRHGSLLFS